MSHQVAANYTMPTVIDSLKPAGTSGTTKSNATSSTTGTSTPSNTTSLGSTFLSLLATELQNQDPTAPVDSTAMVGQMISLNQLDQLISINQAITSTTTTDSASAVGPSAASSTGAPTASGTGAVASSLSPSAQVVAMQGQLPFDPNTMMPLNSAPGDLNSSSASSNSSAIPTNTNVNRTASGGK